MKKNISKIVTFAIVAVSFWVMLEVGLPDPTQVESNTPVEKMLGDLDNRGF